MRAAVIGGTYPYSFTLTDQPAGMTVDSRGVITWPNPPASDSSITLTVATDSEGSQAQTTWSITVEANKTRPGLRRSDIRDRDDFESFGKISIIFRREWK